MSKAGRSKGSSRGPAGVSASYTYSTKSSPAVFAGIANALPFPTKAADGTPAYRGGQPKPDVASGALAFRQFPKGG
jgi:hypothetical protein